MSSQQQVSTTPPDARDEWRTPAFVFEFMDRIHLFDLDLAATESNRLCEHFMSHDDDALRVPWHPGEGAGWCNPPYSNIEPWGIKARNEAALGFTTVMLLPLRLGSRTRQGSETAPGLANAYT